MKHIFLFEELTGKYKEQTEILYKDKNLVCLIPRSQMTSNLYGKKTNWCSAISCDMFDEWTSRNLLFRFLFKDSKIRLTYNYIDYTFNWALEDGWHMFSHDKHDVWKNPFEITEFELDNFLKKIDSPTYKKKTRRLFDKIHKIPDLCQHIVIEFIRKFNRQLPKDYYFKSNSRYLSPRERDFVEFQDYISDTLKKCKNFNAVAYNAAGPTYHKSGGVSFEKGESKNIKYILKWTNYDEYEPNHKNNIEKFSNLEDIRRRFDELAAQYME